MCTLKGIMDSFKLNVQRHMWKVFLAFVVALVAFNLYFDQGENNHITEPAKDHKSVDLETTLAEEIGTNVTG